MSKRTGDATDRVRDGRFTIETEQEEDGRWIAEVRELAGVVQYGRTRVEAIARAEALALRVPRPGGDRAAHAGAYRKEDGTGPGGPVSLIGQCGLDSAPC